MPFLRSSKAAAHDGANGILPPAAEIMSSETDLDDRFSSLPNHISTCMLPMCRRCGGRG